MKRTIMEMAQTISHGWWLDDNKLEAFADLVRADERDKWMERTANMNIIEMARQAGFLTNEIKSYAISPYKDEDHDLIEELEVFAKLVAAQTLMKIDPSSFMSYQEGFEAGQLAEREGCAKLCDESEYPDGIDLAYLIRARGQE